MTTQAAPPGLPPLPRTRLLFVLAASFPSSPRARLFRSLAVDSSMEVEVLFLEDADLLGLAALPFALEIGLASGLARTMLRHDVERTLQAAARRAEQELRELAAQHRFRYTFEVRREHLRAAWDRAARPADVIVLEPQRTLRASWHGALSSPRVFVRYDPASASSEHVFSTALALAGDRREAIVVLVPAVHAGLSTAEKSRLAAHLGVRADRIKTIRETPAAGRDALLDSLSPGRQDVLVLSTEAVEDGIPAWSQWIENRTCTVALVR